MRGTGTLNALTGLAAVHFQYLEERGLPFVHTVPPMMGKGVQHEV